jgi:hypothetical protein
VLTHGANDAQVDRIAVMLLLAAGETSHFTSPIWAEIACGAPDRGYDALAAG